MLAWLFGAEKSYMKALSFNLLTFTLLCLFGTFLYGFLVGLPMLVLKLTGNDK